MYSLHTTKRSFEACIGSGYLLATFQARGVGAMSPSCKLRSLLGSWDIAQNSWFLTQMSPQPCAATCASGLWPTLRYPRLLLKVSQYQKVFLPQDYLLTYWYYYKLALCVVGEPWRNSSHIAPIPQISFTRYIATYIPTSNNRSTKPDWRSLLWIRI